MSDLIFITWIIRIMVLCLVCYFLGRHFGYDEGWKDGCKSQQGTLFSENE